MATVRRCRPILLLAALSWGCVGDPPAAELGPAERARLERLLTDAPPGQMIRTDASFDTVTLVGYLLRPRTLRHQAGSSVDLTLVWRVDRPLAPGWRAFTHLTDRRGRMLVNLDERGPLRALAGVSGTPLPPSRWPARRHVLDELRFAVPLDAPSEVRIVTGFYRGRERLAPGGKASDARARAAVIALTVTPGSEAAVPELTVPRLAGSAGIVIDGALDEPAWAVAAATGAFVDVATGAAATSSPVQGRARLLWDADRLYVAFEVEDATVHGGFPPDTVDPHLWERDCVELMIDPDGDGDNQDYYEIQIGPQNLVFDSQFDRYNQPRAGGRFGHQDWSAALTSAVAVAGTLDRDSDRDRGYTVEAALPWRAFDKAKHVPPRPGDQWRINLYAMQDNGGVAWSPILGQGNFHRAARFGRVRWSGKEVP